MPDYVIWLILLGIYSACGIFSTIIMLLVVMFDHPDWFFSGTILKMIQKHKSRTILKMIRKYK
jgi:hypothetical protein